MRTTTILALAALACLSLSACGAMRNGSHSDTAHNNPNATVNVHLPGEDDDGNQHNFAGQWPERRVDYNVDNKQHSDEVATEEDITTLYLKLLGYAKLGHNVSITARGDNPQGTKTDEQTYTSDSEALAAAWAARMVRKGYSVKIEYDKSAKTYTCTAYKRK
jgi:hypothetical protein